MWNHKTPGIPDEEFERTESVPITKEEVRIIQIGKARLNSGDTVFDIGCGSGSISVEVGLQVGKDGKVFAVDVDSNAIELTKKNLKKFQVDNVTMVEGNAKEKSRNFLWQTQYSLVVPVGTQKTSLSFARTN